MKYLSDDSAVTGTATYYYDAAKGIMQDSASGIKGYENLFIGSLHL